MSNELFPIITITLLILLARSATSMVARGGGTAAPAPDSAGLEECYKMARDMKCKDEFVAGAARKGRVVKHCCGVLREVGNNCFTAILKDYEESGPKNVDWIAFWDNSSKILNQCQMS
ncbi:hypothetical protein DM860_003394 [Cuscuta australis]|uniref:Prolamin-like domain-containing protein n=1 Tax=Cuscuta australis TaxID=267555 RepID=A0A328DFP1_9ASTE|nr:hypothetical protein DM860_003394 [Cuscuta australis]